MKRVKVLFGGISRCWLYDDTTVIPRGIDGRVLFWPAFLLCKASAILGESFVVGFEPSFQLRLTGEWEEV